MQAINYLELGGTLFIPAIHKSMADIVSGGKYPHLKSVVVDLEDSIAHQSVDDAFANLQSLVKSYKKKQLYFFVRPRNTQMLQNILSIEDIEKVDGFLLPKFSLSNARDYLRLLEGTEFSFMPSIEGEELFDANKLKELREILLPYRTQIVLVRFGLQDMLRQLKMQSSCDESIFDVSVGSVVLGNFIAIFKSAGFAISGGVYKCFKDTEGFRKDVLRDIKEGLFTKTIIHPNQIRIINDLYKVSAEEYEQAQRLLVSESAVYNDDAKMAEVQTMSPYAVQIVERAKIYGISDGKNR